MRVIFYCDCIPFEIEGYDVGNPAAKHKLMIDSFLKQCFFS